jgi:hypothetical protein
VVPSIKSTNMLPRRGIRSGKIKKRRQYPIHMVERIYVTIIAIAISMVTLRKSFGNYIQR